MKWSEHQIAKLVRLTDAGFSAREVGLRLGVSRNAVIGKLFRLQLNVAAKDREARNAAERMRYRMRYRERKDQEARERQRQLKERKEAHAAHRARIDSIVDPVIQPPTDKPSQFCRFADCRKARQPGRDYCAEHHDQFVVSKLERRNAGGGFAPAQGRSSLADA